ncbi:Rne/Rng family ribonuclease [Sphingopyxis yananensis]|uniref:Rne/Rng family ribonuclease n=1 Tax=Sphingopyxis yananensis TaxID=2886687 RepID=UPI001D1098B8|nr:ribonuclease E/G [Sphingopyxis yananensis]MCC2601193.1 Rne/Rng family ribonuclease [Sphingopyxis yananensis]
MTTRMLIDARHREETRVAVTKGNRIEEFDFESAEHKQLKGNIYLAKVTRVEPSLQAAFVEYGGNRHGFLAFSEIHPDYYQIPKEDRDALIREEAEHAAAAAMRAEEDLDDLEGDVADVEGFDDDNGDRPAAPEVVGEAIHGDGQDDDRDADDSDSDDQDDQDDQDAEARDGDGDNGDSEGEGAENGEGHDNRRRRYRGRKGRNGRNRRDEDDSENRMSLRRRYKIQDVIRRRQVLLVQVVKEERGNKGAALTTYLSLAGRYCVLMPNTMHGGGISRKISNGADRRKLKAMIDEMNLPPSMGCIVRTAGMSRTKTEIKRDFDYLARLWDEIRDRTIHSSAPALIHSDSDLIKRAIRDIYHRDIEEVLVEGEDGYRAAKQFMRLLMPSHARKVKQYADPISLYQRYGVEDQLNGMLNPVVQLKSGGYLVINPTEALVSIDINSGRSTREHNIEQTALSTNLEAAHEIARQLRLRDMAGLVVIDFIDMDHSSNVRKVERAMKDALKNDRARIQIGRISGFGLMEMSRQRLRTGVLEASTRPCPHCDGSGLVRTASSAGLSALRLIEEEAARGKGSKILLRASQEATFYLLNEKRREVQDIEELYGVIVIILPNNEIEGGRMTVEVSGPPPLVRRSYAPVQLLEDDSDFDDEIEEDEDEQDEDSEPLSDPQGSARPEGEEGDAEAEGEGEGRRRRRRRRRGRRGRRDEEQNDEQQNDSPAAETLASESDASSNGDGQTDVDADATAPMDEGTVAAPRDDQPKSRRRRGGRGRGSSASAVESTSETSSDTPSEPTPETTAEPVAETPSGAESTADSAAVVDRADAVETAPAATEVHAAEAEAPAEKPKRKRAPRKTAKAKAEEAAEQAATEAAIATEPAAPAESEPASAASDDAATAETAEPAPKKRAPRKRKTAAETAAAKAEAEAKAAAASVDAPAEAEAEAEAIAVEADADAKPAPKKRAPRKRKTAAETAAAKAEKAAAADSSDTSTGQADADVAAPAEPSPVPAPAAAPAAEAAPDTTLAEGESPRRGWWQRTFGE